jgi:ACS family glucarate transporter-like MFS transporter
MNEPSAPTDTTVRWPATRHWFVLGTFLLSVLLYVDRVCISAAEADVRADLGLSQREMGWVMSAFALGYALCQAPTGALADRYGARCMLSVVVVAWSIFTGLTAAASNLATMLVVRLLFGAGEAGAFPGIARAVYSWIPMRERGLVQGINFSGGRLGAAMALPAVATSIDAIGWRATFVALMVIGFFWAVWWWFWFRDDPAEHRSISRAELEHIVAMRQPRTQQDVPPFPLARLWGSGNMWLLAGQYFCSNFTFFFCLTWLYPHLKRTYELSNLEASVYASLPFVCGAAGNWVAGWVVDWIFKGGQWRLSRLGPAAIGFFLAAIGVVGCAWAKTPLPSVAWLSLAVFGADMTLAPSWSVCIDIGGRRSGLVSGTMNMAGNIGSFVTGLAFPYLAAWTGSYVPFFYVAAVLNVAAIVAWQFIEPRRSLESA